MKLSYILYFSLLLVLSACYYDNEEELYPVLGNQCDTSNVTFKVSVMNVITENCLGCHAGSASSGGGIKLETYSQITGNIDNIIGDINHKSSFNAMPKGAAKMSDCRIQIIELWKTKGMINN